MKYGSTEFRAQREPLPVTSRSRTRAKASELPSTSMADPLRSSGPPGSLPTDAPSQPARNAAPERAAATRSEVRSSADVTSSSIVPRIATHVRALPTMPSKVPSIVAVACRRYVRRSFTATSMPGTGSRENVARRRQRRRGHAGARLPRCRDAGCGRLRWTIDSGGPILCAQVRRLLSAERSRIIRTAWGRTPTDQASV